MEKNAEILKAYLIARPGNGRPDGVYLRLDPGGRVRLYEQRLTAEGCKWFTTNGRDKAPIEAVREQALDVSNVTAPLWGLLDPEDLAAFLEGEGL